MAVKSKAVKTSKVSKVNADVIQPKVLEIEDILEDDAEFGHLHLNPIWSKPAKQWTRKEIKNVDFQFVVLNDELTFGHLRLLEKMGEGYSTIFEDMVDFLASFTVYPLVENEYIFVKFPYELAERVVLLLQPEEVTNFMGDIQKATSIEGEIAPN